MFVAAGGFSMDGKLRLSFASWLYDRMEALRDGRVAPEGIDLQYITLWVSEIFQRTIKHQAFDVSELSFGEYIKSIPDAGNGPFIAIPAFPSRMFRHRSIFINKNSGIRNASDLKGKRIGILRYAQTASIWIRGIMADHYDVPIDSVDYFIGPLEKSINDGASLLSSTGKIWNTNIRTQKIDDGEGLSQMLQDGEIDALYTSRNPSTFGKESSNVRRLFPQYWDEELRYFRKTGIFPIMHTIVLKMDAYRKNPWIAESMLKALDKSKEIAQKDLEVTGVLKNMYPWMLEKLDEWKDAIGSDYWPYGVKSNLPTLDAFLRYCHDQGVTRREMTIDEVFAKESIEHFGKESDIS